MKKYVATSVLVMLVAGLSFAAVVWYADRDDDAMHFSVEGEYGDQVSVVGWPAVEGEDGTKYVNLRPAMKRDVPSNPSRQPDRDDDAMHFSVVGWPSVEDAYGTKYINLRPAMKGDVAPNPSRQPNTAPDCDGIDCQQNG